MYLKLRRFVWFFKDFWRSFKWRASRWAFWVDVEVENGFGLEIFGVCSDFYSLYWFNGQITFLSFWKNFGQIFSNGNLKSRIVVKNFGNFLKAKNGKIHTFTVLIVYLWKFIIMGKIAYSFNRENWRRIDQALESGGVEIDWRAKNWFFGNYFLFF